MPDPDRIKEHEIRETAYFIWEQEGRPDGRAQDHWLRALDQADAPSAPAPSAPAPSAPAQTAAAQAAAAPRKPARRAARRSVEARVQVPDNLEDEEKVLAGRPDANMPALLTKDVPGG